MCEKIAKLCLRFGWIGLAIFSLLMIQTLSSSVADAQQRYSFGTSPLGGSWYQMAAAVSELMNKNVPGVTFTVEGTGGGSINPKWMADKKIEFGFQVLDMFTFAKGGEKPFDRKYDFSHVRSICLIGAAPTHWIVKRNSPFKEIKDLKGKRISIGDRGASSNTRAFWFLEAAGLTANDVKVEYIGDDQAAEALSDGKIDAICEVVGVPSGAFLSLAMNTPIRLLALTTGEEIKKLLQNRPYFVKLTIPAGAYKQPEEVISYGVPSFLMVLDTIPEDLVYNMCKLIDANWEFLFKVHRSFRDWRFAKDTAEMSGQPLHPGAVKFYKEKGIF